MGEGNMVGKWPEETMDPLGKASWARRLFCIALAGFTLLASSCRSLPDMASIDPQKPYRHVLPVVVNGQSMLVPEEAARQVQAAAGTAEDARWLRGVLGATATFTDAPLYDGNRLTLLEDGPATYAAMRKAIQSATDHIHLETYIFAEDDFGRSFVELLAKKQREGVQVAVIVDGVGTMLRSSPDFFKPITDAGGQLLVYHPINPLKAAGDWRLNRRDHKRILVIDGKVAFTGGVNISSTYRRSVLKSRRIPFDPMKHAWRDTDIQVEGPAVAEFQRLFLDTWQRKAKTALTKRNWFPSNVVGGAQLAQVIAYNPERPGNPIYQAYISAIKLARKRVYITNSYFVPDAQFTQALVEAAARGVDVRLVLPSMSDYGIVQRAAQSRYSDLLRGGVKIYERKNAMMHAKTAIVDGHWATVGSLNLDFRSFLHNEEINVITYERSFARQMEQSFALDMKNSRQITLEEWQRRPAKARIMENLSRIIEYYL